MEEKKLRAKERLMRKRMAFRFSFVVIMLIFGVLSGFATENKNVEKIGVFARYMGVLGLALYSLFFIKKSALPEKKETLQAMAQAFFIGVFAFSLAGFALMTMGHKKILALEISTIVSGFSLLLITAVLVSFWLLNRKAFK